MVGRLAIGWGQASTLRASPPLRMGGGSSVFIAIAHPGWRRHNKV